MTKETNRVVTFAVIVALVVGFLHASTGRYQLGSTDTAFSETPLLIDTWTGRVWFRTTGEKGWIRW